MRSNPLVAAGLAVAVCLAVGGMVWLVARSDLLGGDGDEATGAGGATGAPHVSSHPAAGDGGPASPAEVEFDPAGYQANLAFVLGTTVRNTNHDGSQFLDVASSELVLEDHLGPRSDYLGNPGGNAEQSFPVIEGGQFRAGCEFSHFAYDDPLVFPNSPGASHLHMFFGNNHVNAYSTYETLIDSGSSTCNGQELNRTGYWVPAMFDGDGNVRVPERVVVYYKGEGLARGQSVPYPERAALIARDNINLIDVDTGGAQGKYSFVCSDQWSGPSEPASNTMPDCDGDTFFDLYGVEDDPHVVLEMNVKFPQCWSGQDPANWRDSYAVPTVGGWYNSDCGGDHAVHLPNLEYFVNYRVDIGESTSDWYLASDVDPATFARAGVAGESVHGDWWGGWNAEVMQTWIDNCVNYQAEVPSDCGFGYLTDGGPDGGNPVDGPALKYRPQYEGPYKIPAATIFEQLCSSMTDRAFTKPEDAAYCVPG